MKRILLLRSSIGVFGAERVVLELADGLRKKQFYPTVGVIGNKSPASKELSYEAQRLGLDSVFFSCKYPFDINTIFQIISYVRKNNINIIHAHGYKANFYALATAKFTNSGCIATLHPWTETNYNLKSRIYTFLDKAWLRMMDSLVAVSEDMQAHKPHGRSDMEAVTVELLK